MANEALAVRWNKAKKTFEEMTGKSKPKESKGIFNAFGSYTGLSGALEKFDKAWDHSETTSTMPEVDLKAGNKYVDEMEVALASFRKASASYQQVLGKTITQQIDKRSEPDVKTAYERALKYLSKELAAIEEFGAAQAAFHRQQFDKAGRALSANEKYLRTWQTNMKSALAKAAAAAAKVKVSPTVQTYNSIFPDAARDITMQLGVARQLNGFLVDPAVIQKTMAPWGQQTGQPPATLPNDATEQDVIRYLVGFIGELKKAQQLFATRNAYM